MKISVLIPCYNSGKTIEGTLNSVFGQSEAATEIILLLDGGNDDTETRLEKYSDKIRLIKQPNMGVACARNRLAAEAKGDLLAFLDSDDIWHPDYLKEQKKMFLKYPDAVAGFTGHLRFKGDHQVWTEWPAPTNQPVELIDPLSFLTRYNITTAVFGSMSYCCVRRSAIERLGKEPFSNDLHAVEDSFLCYQMPLIGSVVFNPRTLVAYRLTEGSLSVNRVRNLGRWVMAFERLQDRYHAQNSARLEATFSYWHASTRRQYGRILMGAGRAGEARSELWKSFKNSNSPTSLAKSLAWLVMATLPKSLQPKWPSTVREIG